MRHQQYVVRFGAGMIPWLLTLLVSRHWGGHPGPVALSSAGVDPREFSGTAALLTPHPPTNWVDVLSGYDRRVKIPAGSRAACRQPGVTTYRLSQSLLYGPGA
jgi:hypothetical protein